MKPRTSPPPMRPSRVQLRADYMAAVRESGLSRPRTRAECADGPRPCPWVSCRYHLALDLHGRRCVIIVADPDTWTSDTPTCALDLADGAGLAGGQSSYNMTLEAVAAVMGGRSRERIRQIEAKALEKLEAVSEGILSAWRAAP